ncbi:MAG: SIS domain-containing protein [Chloroflexi bacterium]|nr:SIS domain-containing protein [Chloroflexota bacterium]
MTAGQHTLREIMSQPEVWATALAVVDPDDPQLRSLLASGAFDRVIVTGCGSTYYLALTAASLLRQAGCHALACPASELLLHPNSVCLPGQRYLLLSVSRSGSTTETVRAQETFKAYARSPVLAVTCDSGSPLASDADVVIAIDGAQENSVAQTRSFSSMAVAVQQLAALVGGRDLGASRKLPATCRHLLERYGDLAQSLGENSNIAKFFFLGSGALYGIACEAMLKMKEMSLSYSEAYHTLEFRHGPMSMVGADSLVIGLISPDAARHEGRVLQEMAAMGATVLAIGPELGEYQHQVILPVDLPTWCMPILYLPALQLLAYHRAIFNGCDPDQPHQLSAVISLDDI